jgi:hypothetical protein
MRLANLARGSAACSRVRVQVMRAAKSERGQQPLVLRVIGQCSLESLSGTNSLRGEPRDREWLLPEKSGAGFAPRGFAAPGPEAQARHTSEWTSATLPHTGSTRVVRVFSANLCGVWASRSDRLPMPAACKDGIVDDDTFLREATLASY